MEILSSIVGTVANHTVVPIGRQASYLIFYKGNFSMLAVHVKDLEAAKKRMLHFVEEERRNGKKIERDVMNWLDIVDEVIEKAYELQQDPRRANARCSAWSFPNLILRHRLSRKATKIVKDFIEVQEKGKFDRIGYLPTLDGISFSSFSSSSSSSSSTRGGEKYETRESFKENIMNALMHHNSCNIGVYGLGGVGKTTLVEEVSEISKKRNLFDAVVKTHVSETPDIKKIQGEIADLLGLRFNEETILGRAHRLRQRIMRERNILVILDDIWTELDLKRVGIPFGNEHNGCKLLMTSRNLDVLLNMDVPKDFTFKLELMSENESWKLFQIMAGDVVKDINLQSLAIQVAKKCAGLPLMVARVARAIKGKRDVQSWNDALRRLQRDHHSSLELSYNSLESDEMRDVFLLFALFPYEKVHYFLKVAMGLDILKDIKTVDDARNRLYSIIHSLEATCLIEIKTSGNIQMHDFVRDFAISIARRDKHVFLRKQSDEEWPTKDFLTRCTQVVLDSCVSELPQMIDCPNIMFFSLSSKKNRSLEVPGDFFEGMGSLRVLVLTFLNLSSLPTSFRFLTDLQTLCLNFCILENMVEINALQNLVILSLLGSSITKLPREIGQLTRLRILNLSKSGIEVIPPNILSSLTKLEELYIGNTFVNWEDVSSMAQNKNASIAELRKLPYLTTLELQIRETRMLPRDMQTVFEKLKRYKIAIGDVWEWSDIVNGTSNTLMLKLETNIHLYHGIKALIKGVENLYLDDVGGIQNVFYQLNAEGFPLLKHLHVQNNANMKHIVDSQERNQIRVSFPFLESLVLHNLKNLGHIWNRIWNDSHQSMCNLTSLIVASCAGLKYLFSSTMVESFKKLKHLEISNCPLTEIIAKEENEIEEESNSHCLDNKCVGSLFPKLEVLDIEGCPLLEFIFPFLVVQDLPVLETIKIRRCDGLKCIFGQYQDAEFSSLRQLELSQLPNFIDMFCKSNHHISKLPLDPLKCNIFSGDTATTTTPLVDGVDYSRKGAGNSEFSHKESNSHRLNNKCVGSKFPKLEVVDIEGCPLLEFIFPFLVVQDLPVLETIKIRRCHGLKFMFGQYQHVEFSSLRQLELSQLPNFIDMFRKTNQPISSYEKGSSSTFNSDSKAILQLDLDPMKCNIFSEDTTTTTIPLVDGVDSSESNSYYLNIWNQAQCLQIPSKILYNIKKIELSHFAKIKSVFIPSIAPRMLVETLIIRNCDELKNIIDFGDYDSGSNNWCNVFPKMKELYIEGCPKMEYIFGQYTDDHQNKVEIQLHLLKLNCLNLCNLPSLVAMCPKHYKIILPILEKFKLSQCSQAAIKSMSHVRIHPVSESLDSTIIKEDGAGQIVITKSTTQHINGETWQEPKKTNDVQVSRNNDAFKKEGSNIVEQFPKDHHTIVSKSLVASQFPSVPSKGDPSQNVEYLTSSLLFTRELEQLVSKKHLDYENLSLLTDFLVKRPSLCLKDTSVSNRYKGCAYNLLAELLKFLQTHSVLDVLGSCRTEFVELLQDARSFGFDKDWLDDVERRALFPDRQVYQDTLQKVLDSRQQVTKDVEVLCSKIEGLKNQLTSSEAVLKNITQQDATIIAPIGY